MRKFLLLVLSLSALAFGQTDLNFTGLNDTAIITNFKYDSLRITKAFNFTNAENKLLVFAFDDTMNAARSSDSVACEIGCQLGVPFKNLTGTMDTLWTNNIFLDTCNTLTDDRKYDPSKYATASIWSLDDNGNPTIRPGQIDTTIGTTGSAMYIPFSNYWAPLIRFYLKGITGNAHTAIKGRFTFEQRNYSIVRVK